MRHAWLEAGLANPRCGVTVLAGCGSSIMILRVCGIMTLFNAGAPPLVCWIFHFGTLRMCRYRTWVCGRIKGYS
jgi:hypothetical protein